MIATGRSMSYVKNHDDNMHKHRQTPRLGRGADGVPETRRRYVERLRNPYAWLGTGHTEDGSDHLEHVTHVELSQKERDYLSRLQNPYARLAFEGADAPLPASAEDSVGNDPAKSSTGFAASRKASLPSVSKVEFRRRCRLIFSQYIPALERGKIRSHHRDFISRNESRTPEERGMILEALQRYDLSTIPGLSAQFNRERDPFTERKLRKIENLAEKVRS